MEINYLKEFVSLAKTCSYFETAEDFFISQSSLSRHIKTLEETLGVPLFNRTTRKVSLTEYGAQFLPYAKQIVDLQDEYLNELSLKLNNESNDLTIGTIPVMSYYNITDELISFQQEYPQYAVHMFEGDSLLLMDMLKKDKLSGAFVRESSAPPQEYVKIPYSSDHLVAILPVHHPLAGQSALTLTDLADESFLLLSEDTFMYSFCITSCHDAGFDPKVAFTCRYGNNLINLVSQGMGVALLTSAPALNMLQPGAIAIDIDPPLTTSIDFIYKSEKKNNRALARFLDFLNSNICPELAGRNIL